MPTPLTKEQIRNVYRAIIIQDEEFVRLFAVKHRDAVNGMNVGFRQQLRAQVWFPES